MMRRPSRKMTILCAVGQAWDDLMTVRRRMKRGDVDDLERLGGYAALLSALEWWRTSEYPRIRLGKGGRICRPR